MNPEEESGFETGGLWTMRFQPSIIPGLWSGMISEFCRNLTMIRFQIVIWISGGIRKNKNQVIKEKDDSF
jgi:hypothetical protein